MTDDKTPTEMEIAQGVKLTTVIKALREIKMQSNCKLGQGGRDKRWASSGAHQPGCAHCAESLRRSRRGRCKHDERMNDSYRCRFMSC